MNKRHGKYKKKEKSVIKNYGKIKYEIQVMRLCSRHK